MSEPTITRPGRERPRRLRRTPILRDLVGETSVAAAQLIMPHFVMPTAEGREAIPSMPGIDQVGTETLLGDVESDLELGIRSVLLFGHPQAGGKTPTAIVISSSGIASRRIERRSSSRRL